MSICKLFYKHCKDKNISLSSGNFTLSYDTNIPRQQSQQPVPLIQQQMLPRGRVYRYPPGRGGLPDGSMPNVAGGMLSVPYDMGGMPMRDASLFQPVTIGALSTYLANATPDQQRTDFSKEYMDEFGHGIYTPMDIDLLPPLHLIYAENPSDSAKVHITLRQKF